MSSENHYKLYYAAGASYNAMIHWLKGGCKESAEEMSRHILEFFGMKE